jgi:hypothetical protein
MNELVQLVQQKTGLSADMAQTVVTTVIGFIKTKLPGPLSTGLDELMGTEANATGAAAGAAADAGGGLLGKAESMLSDMFKKKDA